MAIGDPNAGYKNTLFHYILMFTMLIRVFLKASQNFTVICQVFDKYYLSRYRQKFQCVI